MHVWSTAWPFLPAHAEAFIRLHKMLTGTQGFKLCFLVFSDTAYRRKVAGFLADQLHAHTQVAIDETESIGTEELFIRLDQSPPHQPVQLSGLENWPEGLDNLLARLNLRREALGERCQRPLLFWALSSHLKEIATGAADLWAWRSGIFQFALPSRPLPAQTLEHSPIFSLSEAEAAKRRKRIRDLLDYLTESPVMLSHHVEMLLEAGGLWLSLGEIHEAERCYRRAEAACWAIRDERQRAKVACGLADVLEARGQLEPALRLRQEQVPVFEGLRDIRAVAVTQGKIADILRVRGELADALRLLVENVIPIYERLGDMRSKAIALGGVADIHCEAGRLEEALRIHTEERVPVFSRLGEVRLLAHVQGKMADVLQAAGRFDEALRIHRAEALPAYEQAGDLHAAAVAWSKIGDIHHARGELDDALHIRTEEQLPAFGRLGDRRSTAVTQGQIASIRQAQGRLDEALRLRLDVELPIYEQIGDRRAQAVAIDQLADLLEAQGRLDEALRRRRNDELPLYEQLGDVRRSAMAKEKIANLLDQLERGEEAARLLATLEFPVDRAFGSLRPPHSDVVEETPEYVPYETGGDRVGASVRSNRVLLEGRLTDRAANTYKTCPSTPTASFAP